ncbi:MAG: DUF4115 domain-containing protein [Rickettsiales bacterium]|jgi:cytoskeletal protein RodZ|nr:DUF4115 domain-containing protein [Rickettsiales bacterium]
MTEIQDKNPEVLTAGQMLRNARTTGRRKRELGTIAKQLCIKEGFLEALENGDYHKIPEVVYILGFARNYAVELELNPDEIIKKIKDELGIISEEEMVARKERAMAASRPDHKKQIKQTLDTAQKFMRKNWKWFGGAVGCIVAILLVVWGVTAIISNTGGADTPVQVATNLPEFNKKINEEFGIENKATANIILQTTKESWVKIDDATGETLFSKVMMPGDVYYLPGGKLRGNFGNAGVIDVWVDGTLAPKLGEENTRREKVSMTAEDLTKPKEDKK